MSAPTVTLLEAQQRYDETYRRQCKAWDDMNSKARNVADALVNIADSDMAVDIAREFAAEYAEAKVAWEHALEEDRQAYEAQRAARDATS